MQDDYCTLILADIESFILLLVPSIRYQTHKEEWFLEVYASQIKLHTSMYLLTLLHLPIYPTQEMPF